MFKVIIWATDGSSGAEQALQLAKDLALAHGARLVVVHVNEFMVGRAVGYPVNLDEDEVQAAIRKHVEDLKQEGLNATLQAANVSVGDLAFAGSTTDYADHARNHICAV